jgi:hypothetical protein
MTPFTEEQKKAAKSLAVLYELFNTQIEKNSRDAWLEASLLLEAQEKTGVEMMPCDILEFFINQEREDG